MAAKKRICVSQNSHMTKIWKTTFPEEFFNKIGLKVGDRSLFLLGGGR